MHIVGAFEAKNTLGTLLDAVEQGEEIIITRHGKPVAKLVPNTEEIDRRQAHLVAKRIRTRGARLRLGPLDWKALKSDRDKGRP
ncbi:MAG: type II toxin-antitoxin system prevent-host-death family antitoxin [Acidobacteriaceae bacterium]